MKEVFKINIFIIDSWVDLDGVDSVGYMAQFIIIILQYSIFKGRLAVNFIT